MENPINYWYQKYISLKAEMDKMLKEAVEGEVQMKYNGGLCAKTIRPINEDMFRLGDKVRIIIVKED